MHSVRNINFDQNSKVCSEKKSNTSYIPRSVQLQNKVIICFLYLIIFEGIILKPFVSRDIGLLIITITDFLPLFYWILTIPVFQYQKRNRFINSLDFWSLWIVLIILLAIGDLRHSSGISNSIKHVGALIRFIPLAFLIIETKKYECLNKKIIHHIDIISRIVIITSWISILLGHKASILLPILPVNNTALRELKEGWHSGIFSNTIDLGFILAIFYAYWVFHKQVTPKKIILLTVLIGFPAYKTGSVASLGIIGLIFLYRISYKKKHLKRWIIVILSTSILGIIFVLRDYITYMINYAMQSRLGVITRTLPSFLKEHSMDTFFGVGTDMDVIYEKVNSYPEKVHILENMKELGGFADVYWVALLIYHGVIGFLIIVGLLYMCYHTLNKAKYNNDLILYKGLVRSLFLMVIILGFFNQILAVKTFALFFWTLLGIAYCNILPNKKTNYDHMEKIF